MGYRPETARPFTVPCCVRPFANEREWSEPEPDEINPVTAEARASVWPLDPLGPYPGDRTPGRRGAVEARAVLVRAAADTLPIGLGERAGLWRIDVDRLLAERARLAGGSTVEVELPRHLSVSQLVELERDPGELARSIRRPLLRQPHPRARHGTAFQTWLEERWQAQTLLDLSQLPGAADETADNGDFEALRAAFPRQRVGRAQAYRRRSESSRRPAGGIPVGVGEVVRDS